VAAARPAGAGRLERLLRPRSVAIVGASATAGALGNTLLLNLERACFKGDIYLINPKRDAIDTRPCLKTIADLPEGVDVAVLAIPRDAVLESLRSLGTRGVGATIIFSAGFAESGALGLNEQREIARIAATANMVVQGPNCLGSINFVDNVPLSFIEMPPIRVKNNRRVGIVSQSGAMAAVIAVTLMAKELALSCFISTGNEAASGVEDYVEYLIESDETQAILLVVEQFRQPKRFLALAARARTAGKPIVLLHPGRSAAARASATTHTGAMAGDHEVMRVLVERAGVVLCRDLEETGDVLELALRFGPMAGGSAVLCESGALKSLSLDVAEEVGLNLPMLTDANSPRLRAAMPEFVAVSNPVDLTAQPLVDPDIYRRVLSALIEDERLGAIIICVIQTNEATVERKFSAIRNALETLKPNKPVIFAGVDEGAEFSRSHIAALRRLGVPYFPTPDRAFRAVARWGRKRSRATSNAKEIRHAARLPQGAGVLPEYKSKQWLAFAGLPFPAGRMVTTLQEAQAVAAQVGWPIVLKAQSVQLNHKSDVGGVVLNLSDKAALGEGWSALHTNIAAHRPGLVLDGVLIEAMQKRGTELIVGGRNDTDWGPVLLVGFGGVMAEIFHDVRLIPPDLTRDEIVHELHSLKASTLFRGFRGAPALDVDAVSELIITLGQLLLGESRLKEIDLNPVVVYPVGEGVLALDALIVIGPAESAAG
jgi:acetate---CoA ligase (ADP-forming)